MTYLALTQGMADWLQAKSGLVEALRETLFKGGAAFKVLQNAEFAEGPIRMAASKKREIIGVWNTDYLVGTGEEDWGFILLDSQSGLLGRVDISEEVFERSIYVVNQRLQKLLIDGAYIHRSHPNGAHTVLAGRGNRARHYSIAYIEQAVVSENARRNTILCIGPSNEPLNFLTQKVVQEGRRIKELVALANKLVTPGSSRQVLDERHFSDFREKLFPFTKTQSDESAGGEYASIQVSTDSALNSVLDPYQVQSLTYQQWVASDGPLTETQRRILASNSLKKHPLRIIGPGGSGKTLLMQLIALDMLLEARKEGRPIRIFYVVHNAPMREKIAQSLEILLDEELQSLPHDARIDVSTLSDYGRDQLEIEFTTVIDTDAQEAKLFQLEEVTSALDECMQEKQNTVKKSKLLSEVAKSEKLKQVFAVLVMAEISTAIKGHGLEGDRRRYVQSETSLSRLHGYLSPEERGVVFDIFERYHKNVFERYQVLDTDDVALSLLGRLRTPLWELKRKTVGYDYVFVDETQLFNENERMILPLLTKGITDHVPIALALDEAQQVYGQRSAGFATLGIKGITSESLPSIHRSTRSIVRLAFFVVQRCIELFSSDFPDFTNIANQMEPDSHPLAESPHIVVAEGGTKGIPTAVEQRIRKLRKNIRQIVVVCHSEEYWESLLGTLEAANLPLYVIEQRGEKLPQDQPVVALTRPAHVGGQEFDAGILVGLEEGVVPPRVAGNDALASAVEQQAYREMYLAITRARYRIEVMISHRANPTPVLRAAESAGLIDRVKSNKDG